MDFRYIKNEWSIGDTWISENPMNGLGLVRGYLKGPFLAHDSLTCIPRLVPVAILSSSSSTTRAAASGAMA